MKFLRPLFIFGLLAAVGLLCPPARAEYHYFNVASGSDGVVQEVRWPYWNNSYYNTWLSDDWTSTEGVSGYFYNGLALPAAGSPNPVGTRQTVNWSFWPLSNPVNITDTISSGYTSPNTFSMPTIGEGTIFRSPGLWSLWQTNVWYRMAFRTWQPVNGTPHLGYGGTWLRDPVTGNWFHMATVQLPFTVTGIDGVMGFQEDATGGTQPQRTDYRNCYYHSGGKWNRANQFWCYDHGGGVENLGLIETNTAVYYETCSAANTNYTGTLTNGQTSPTLVISNQPASPTFDPIIVSNASATVFGSQLLVQWQIPANSSPQFSWKVDVYTNPAFTGAIVASFNDIDPEARQKLLNLGSAFTPYAKLTIIDIFNQTNAPINLTPVNATLNAATGVSGATNGLNFAYYESVSDIYDAGSGTNWATMPNFASLTPVYQGAVSGLDLTTRRRRNGYAFNYTGYINVATDGIYSFTLKSDAGSKLFVDGQLVVNWDGEHSPSELSGWVGLQAGFHVFNVQYFCDTQPTALFSDYFDALNLSYEGPGITKTIVPGSAYYRVPGGGEPAISLTSPTNGATLSDAAVPLSALVTTNGAMINNVQFYLGNNYWGQASSPPYIANSFFWAGNNNPVHARLFYNGSNIIDSSVNLVTTTNMTLTPWQFCQIFYHNYPSGASIQSGSYSLIGDGMNLLTRQVSGDCTIIAHLAGLPTTAAAPDGSTANSGWQAGIILRGNTNMVPGYPWGFANTAPFTAVFGQVDGGAYYQDESMVNGGGGYASGNLGGQKWFKIQRATNTFTSSVSSDGITWTTVRTNTLTDFGATIYAGFFTYAGPSSNPNVHWASFDSVSLTGNLVGPPGVSVNPSSDTAYTGQTTVLTAIPSGNAPFAYQWQYNNVPISGATNATLTLTNVQPANSGIYSVSLTTSNGAANASATLNVLSAPPGPAQILSNNPVGYWRLNETTGPTAYDSINHFNGAAEGGLVFGVPGVGAPAFPGFEAGNPAAQFNGTDSDIAIPALNLNTNTVTITGWVKRNGSQTAWSGMVFCRAGATTAGLHFGTANELRYTWNNSGGTYNWNSGLVVPDGVWTFVALVIQPSQAVMYLATNGTLYSATNPVANPVQAFAGTTYLGYDPNSSTRRLNGDLDEVAIYNQALTPQQIAQLLAASGTAAPSVNLTNPPAGAAFGSPATINLAANVITNGHSISQVQFYNSSSLLGASTTPPYNFAWSNVRAGSYTLLAEVIYDGSSLVSSPPVFVTVNPLPQAPNTPVVVALASNLVSVSWPIATNATGYLLSRGGVMLAALANTNFLDFDVSPNSTYCYSVVATNNFGSSPAGPANCATTPATGGALIWDAGGSPLGPQDGNGNWGGSTLNWWNGATNVFWADGSLALIGSGTTTNCSVAITSPVTPGGIIFNANNGGTYNISGGAGSLNLSGTPTITANAAATISAYLAGGGLIKTGPGTLTLTAANTNTGAITVSAGKIVSTVSCWYSPRGIGSGNLIINNGATAEFTQTHGFGADAGGRSATINGGTLQFDLENYVSGLTVTGGTITGNGQFRALGTTYNFIASSNTSVIATPIVLFGSPTFNIAKGSNAVDLLVIGNISTNGAYSLTKSGAGLMRCTGNISNSAANITAGTFQMDGSITANTVTVQNTATLSGTGAVNAATTIQAGGTVAPGDGTIGTLNFGSPLTLSGRTVMEINRSATNLSSDLITGVTTLTCGGSLTVTNLGSNALVLGDSFQLFSANTFLGAFSSITLPVLAKNLLWDKSKLYVNGTLAVKMAVSPLITSPAFLGNGTFRLSGTGDAGQLYALQAATNIQPPIPWIAVATNTADSNGLFTFTDPLSTNYLQRFYRVAIP